MAQTFTAGTIAAIVAVVVALALVMAYILIVAPKKGYGWQITPGRINKPISDGVRVRIMSIGTGKYLRWSNDPIRPGGCIDYHSFNFGTPLVYADADRQEATLWKLYQCNSCFPAWVHSDGGPKVFGSYNGGNPLGGPLIYPVSGKWSIYDPVSDVSLRPLSFIDNKGITEIDGNPIAEGHPTQRYTTARVLNVTAEDPTDVPDHAKLAGYTFNNLDLPHWFDLRPVGDISSPTGCTGPNGAFYIKCQVGSEATLVENLPAAPTVTGPFPLKDRYLSISMAPYEECYLVSMTTSPSATYSAFFFEVI